MARVISEIPDLCIQSCDARAGGDPRAVPEFILGNPNLSQLDKAMLGPRSMVLSGDFVEGQRLPEVAVAKQPEISRTPLRQAMDRLVAEGLFERMATGGCRVATFTRTGIADATELRGVVEGTAARIAAERRA